MDPFPKKVEKKVSLPDWRQQLLRITEVVKLSEQRREHSNLTASEALVKAQEIDSVVWKRHPDLASTLNEYRIDTTDLEITEVKPDVFRLGVSEHFSGKRLPEGYVYKGGAARVLLLKALHVQPQIPPRDVDVARLSEVPDTLDQEVAQRFMPDDVALSSHQVVEEIDDHYFQSRDLTINEVYADDQFIFASKQCLLDTVRRIIRPTPHELGWGGDEEKLGPKMLAKVLRFWVETIHLYGEGYLSIDDGQFSEAFIKPFWLLVQLDKAFERNIEVATAYTEKLKQYGQIPKSIQTPEQAAVYLTGLLEGPTFVFRFAESQQFEMEETWYDEADPDDSPKFENNRRRRGSKK